MKVLDEGHTYELAPLDGDAYQTLRFVKRSGSLTKYPGNYESYAGTTMQEVLRALIDRAVYVNQQIPCAETEAAIELFRTAILLFEVRAKRVHGETLDVNLGAIEREGTCPECGHIRCLRHDADAARDK